MITDTQISIRYFTLSWTIKGSAPIEELKDMTERYNRYALAGLPNISLCAPGSLLCIGSKATRKIFTKKYIISNVAIGFAWNPLGFNGLEFYESRDFSKFFQFIADLAVEN